MPLGIASVHPAGGLHLFELPDSVENAQVRGVPFHFSLSEQGVGPLRGNEPSIRSMLAHHLMGAGPVLPVLDHCNNDSAGKGELPALRIAGRAWEI